MDADRLEVLSEREGRLKAQMRCRELQNALDSMDLRITQAERAYALTRIAFHAGIPMDKIKDMIVTKTGVMMKGQKDARPILLHGGDDQAAPRSRAREAG